MTDRCAGAAACPASAASGHAAAAPPSNVMKSRRFIGPSKNKADPGQDKQHIDRDLKLPIREALEDAPSEPRAEQRSWNESDHFPVELRQRRGRWPHEIDNEQRDRLHGEDERLIDAALARLVPSLQAAPDGDEGAGKTSESAGETAKKSGACVRQRSGPQGSARPTQEEIAGIDDQQTSDDMPIGAARKLQQQIDAGRHAENATSQEHGQTAPIDRTQERSNAERLDCDAADDHHLYSVDRVFHEMKKQGAAQGREGKPRDAGDRGSQQNGQHGNGAPCQRLRHRASRKQKPEAETSAKDAAHEPESEDEPSRALPL